MIAIVKYNAGNIKSVQNAVENLGYECIITDRPEELFVADKVIFPGVGEASTAMRHLRQSHLDEAIIRLRQPVLGICLGLQLLCKESEEGNTSCLGVFNTTVKKFPPKDLVPHMGWNNFSTVNNSEILAGIELNDNMYYVHSYYAENCDNTIASCNYIHNFSSIMQKDNFYATQFHPEKSGKIGMKLLNNFLNLES